MEALVLSCGTGGGHNSAAAAVQEEFLRRGHGATLLNPFEPCGGKVAQRVDNAYISVAQAAPGGFGAIYAIGNAYRHLPWRSPVYFANALAAEALGEYLRAHPVDVIVMTHLFPAEMLTCLRSRGETIPKTIFVTTDYTCIPFMEETDCDAYVTPSPMLTGEFTARGIPQERIYPLGIPVRSSFCTGLTREQAKAALNLAPDKRYLLVSGGSIGAGKLEKAIELLCDVTAGTNFRLIVICGSNASVCKHLEKRYGAQAQLIGKTDRMAEYLRACDLYFTKPGGLSTTEAAVMEAPLALLPPIPGCETRNRAFFTGTGMAAEVQLAPRELENTLALLNNPEKLEHMRQCQRSFIPKDAAQRICDLAGAMVPEEAE
ncbi:MAG: glycosyltransferase [Faecousia sp.]